MRTPPSPHPTEVTSEYADPPDSDEAIRLLAAAEEHSRLMAVYLLWLALVTGVRRGELCALRWPDVNHAERDLLIGGS